MLSAELDQRYIYYCVCKQKSAHKCMPSAVISYIQLCTKCQSRWRRVGSYGILSEQNLCFSGRRELARKSSLPPCSFIWTAFLLTLKRTENHASIWNLCVYTGILYCFYNIKDLSVNIKIFVVLLLKWKNVCANYINCLQKLRAIV